MRTIEIGDVLLLKKSYGINSKLKIRCNFKHCGVKYIFELIRENSAIGFTTNWRFLASVARHKFNLINYYIYYKVEKCILF